MCRIQFVTIFHSIDHFEKLPGDQMNPEEDHFGELLLKRTNLGLILLLEINK